MYLDLQEEVLAIKDFRIALFPSLCMSLLDFTLQRGILLKVLLNSFVDYIVGHKMYYLYPLKCL